MTLKKKLLIIAGSIVVTILLIIAFIPTIMQGLGIHPRYDGPTYKAEGRKALIITTSHDLLAPVGETEGKETGVASSEMTHPYYVFLEAGMEVEMGNLVAEIFVEAAREHYDPGIIGPFCLQTCVDKDMDFFIYDVAPRIGGGTNVHLAVGHPYGNTLWGEPMSTGRRLCREIRMALDQNRIADIVT